MAPVGRILEIWRYPISSIGGERVSSASVTLAGVVGDRQYGLIDVASGLPAAPEKDHRWRKALHLSAKYPSAECLAGSLPTISFPGGYSYGVNDRLLNDVLSDYFGFAAAIAAYEHTGASYDFPSTHYRNQHFPLHLLTTTSLDHLSQLQDYATIDSRRFRPTVLIEVDEGDGFLENQWLTRRLRIGAIDLTVSEATKRCGMTFISQPGVEENAEILRTILRHNKRHLGIYCSIDSIGTIHVGDEFSV